MRIFGRTVAWLSAGVAILILGWVGYAELGGPAEQAVMRRRGCLLCHAAPVEPWAQLQAWQPGQSLSAPVEARLRQAHPLLSRGAEDELTSLLIAQQLPLLARQRAGAPGQALYTAKCAACHGKDGSGQPGEYPPLLGSEWLTDEPSRLPEILTQGLRGPITVKGEAWDKTMRAPGLTSPQEVKQVTDFLRKSFAN